MINPETIAQIDIVVQALVLAIVLAGAYQALVKKRLIRHCRIIRVAMVIQLLTVLFRMLPALVTNLRNPGQAPFEGEMLLHHSLGVLLILLFVYISLAVAGWVRVAGPLAWYMRTALIIWSVVFMIGIHLYTRIYGFP
jgi:putative membrane protein